MARILAIVTLSAFAALAAVHPALAQAPASGSASADEQALRALIQDANAGKVTPKMRDDVIFVAGPFPEPMVGIKAYDASQPKRDEIAKSRPNNKTDREMSRLVVAKSGDLAYEFGNHHISWDGVVFARPNNMASQQAAARR